MNYTGDSLVSNHCSVVCSAWLTHGFDADGALGHETKGETR